MLRLRKTTNINNEKGVVFILVISVIIVTMILAISILSINTSQVVSTEAEVRRIQTETLTSGVMEYCISLLANGTFPGVRYIASENLDGTIYNASCDYESSSSSLNISILY